MKTPIPVPTQVVNAVSTYITCNYANAPQKTSIKLFETLIELWLKINDSYLKELSKVYDSFQVKDKAYNIYAHIHINDLKHLTAFIGGKQLKYIDLLRILQSLDLIQINQSYSVTKKFTKSYRPHTRIKYDELNDIAVNFKKIWNNVKTKDELIQAHPTYQQLIEYMYDAKVDLISFYKKITSITETVYKFHKGKPIVMTPKIAYMYKMSALKINLGCHFFSVSSTGRLYTSLTNLPKQTIPYLSYKGVVRYTEIDAVNSQPLLINTLIDNPSFKLVCERGKFYDDMAEELGISRQEFKLLSYAKIFFNDKKIVGKMKDLLNKKYNGLADEINQFKTKSKKESQEWRSSGRESQLLWHQLQKAEADIWVQAALQLHLPVITRHDSILCLPEHVTTVKKLITQKYKLQKINVKLDIKNEEIIRPNCCATHN